MFYNELWSLEFNWLTAVSGVFRPRDERVFVRIDGVFVLELVRDRYV